MEPQDFRKWRKHLGMSQKDAALALGLKRRMIQYYEKGEREGEKVKIPLSVRLACFAIAEGVADYNGPSRKIQRREDEKKADPKKNDAKKNDPARGPGTDAASTPEARDEVRAKQEKKVDRRAAGDAASAGGKENSGRHDAESDPDGDPKDGAKIA